MQPRAIETRYKGYRFRSRLEARWAVFFDALGVKWEYEPEGFELPSGRYLPDFYLPEMDDGWYIEIKPDTKDGLALAGKKIDELTIATRKKGIVFCGEPMVGVNIANDYDTKHHGWWMSCAYASDETGELLSGGDGPYLWCVCNTCGKVGLQFDGRGDRVCGALHGVPHGDKGYSGNWPKIVRAAEAARSARFEHGESGARK